MKKKRPAASPKGTPAFVHKDIPIHIDSDGLFCATVNNILKRRPSLKAIRQDIDSISSFKPFMAIYEDGKPITVVGIKHKTRHRTPHYLWVVKEISWSPSYVTKDTPENRAVMKKLLAKSEKLDALISRSEEELAVLRSQLVKLQADGTNAGREAHGD